MDKLVEIFKDVPGVQITLGHLKDVDKRALQSVVFDKGSWTSEKAEEWLKDKELEYSESDESKSKIFFDQLDVSEFKEDSFTCISSKEYAAHGTAHKKTRKRKRLIENINDDGSAVSDPTPLDPPEPGGEVKGVEIFRSGTWNGDKYSNKDLDDIVAATTKVGFKPPVKLGHSSKPGEPAYGWVKGVRREGDKLIADLINVPDKIMEAIKNRRFDSVSSEIFWNLKRNGETFRRALKAVALLGSDIPGVSNLKPLREVVTSIDSSEFDGVAEHTIHPEEWNMDKLEELETKAAELEAKLAEAVEAKQAAEEQSAKAEELKKELDEASAKLEAAKGKDEEVKKLHSEVETLTKVLNSLESERQTERITKKLEEIKLPTIKEHFKALYSIDTTKVVKFTEGEDEKELSVVEVLDGLVEVLNAETSKLFTHMSPSDPHRGQEDFDGSDTTNLTYQIDKLAQEYSTKNEVSYGDAIKSVLEQNPELKKAYAAS